MGADKGHIFLMFKTAGTVMDTTKHSITSFKGKAKLVAAIFSRISPGDMVDFSETGHLARFV